MDEVVIGSMGGKKKKDSRQPVRAKWWPGIGVALQRSQSGGEGEGGADRGIENTTTTPPAA